ncbi:MAG: SEC-C metal-binding domain-containing protein, partial [Bacteroidia bacterium]
AQKKVEENNFGMRKRLLEYDDVMNSQREVIYTKRRHALFGERLDVDINNMIFDVCEHIVTQYQDERDFEGFKLELIKIFSVETSITDEQFLKNSIQELTEIVHDAVMIRYKEKSELISQNVLPIIKNVYETQGHMYENILIPFTDGIKGMQVSCNLKKSFETGGREVLKTLEKNVILHHIDDAWKEHLREMDDLKQSVQNAVYEQKDPLLIYKFESFELFKQVLQKINKETATFLSKASLPMGNPEQATKAQQAPPKPQPKVNYQTSRSEVPQFAQGQSTNAEERAKPQPIRVEQKIGRNDPCPCGSGKKYKQCHGKDAQ